MARLTTSVYHSLQAIHNICDTHMDDCTTCIFHDREKVKCCIKEITHTYPSSWKEVNQNE